MSIKHTPWEQQRPECSIFSSEQLDSDSGYELWRKAFSPVLEVDLRNSSSVHQYSAKAHFHLVNDCVFGPVYIAPTVYMCSRTSQVDGNDCFLLQMIISGGYGGYNGKHEEYSGKNPMRTPTS